MGLEYARQLAASGHDLVIVSNEEERLGEVAQSLRSQYSVNVLPHYQDLAVPDAADSLYAFCKESGVQVDILINNAGMFFFKELTRENEGRMEAMMNLHMTTPAKLSVLFGADMKARGQGRILIMSSMAALIPAPGITVYSATKAFLKSFGHSLYFEMKPYGVSVTTVCPAAVATPLYKLKPSLMDLGVRLGAIMTPQRLVKRVLRGMFRGRRQMRPGFMNYSTPYFVLLLPEWIENKLWNKYK